MELEPYVDKLREQLAVAASAGGEDALLLAQRLTAALESAVRLTLLDALSTWPLARSSCACAAASPSS
jgi:hypothetical protein